MTTAAKSPSVSSPGSPDRLTQKHIDGEIAALSSQRERLAQEAETLAAARVLARVLGLASDLHLTSGQYNWALSIFFFGYVAFETPSNVILRRVRPSRYIPPLTVRTSLPLVPTHLTSRMCRSYGASSARCSR